MADNQLPLLGAILCCTSIPPEQRADLAAIASQMGAVHKLDLTSDVTHLIVGETDTPKYKFVAKERSDVKCVLPSWIDAIRASWLQGGETNVEELERLHKLPTFTGLKLCVTGFDDLVQRKEIEDAIMNNGGEYTGNLTKDVTHLVAKEPTGAKYTFAGQWGMKIVAVEWVEQCLERGMVLEENLYHLSIPPDQRGKDAWIRRSESTVSLGKRNREDEITVPNARKLRRTASARLSSQNFGLWNELVAAPIEAGERILDAWDDRPKEDHEEAVAPISFKVEHSFPTPAIEQAKSQLKRSHSEADITHFPLPQIQRHGLFGGKTLLSRGFSDRETTILEGHLRSHGAEIVDSASQLPSNGGLVVVPYTTSTSDAALLLDGDTKIAFVTDMWVERCMFFKRAEDPGRHVLNMPVSIFPLAGFENLSICFTGFQGIELLHAAKAVKLMGATYNEYLDASASVLVCKTVLPGHDKLLHTQLWGVPAVSDSWLWDCIGKGRSIPFEPYLVQPITNPNASPEALEASAETLHAPKATITTNTKQKTTKPSLERPPRPTAIPARSDNRKLHEIVTSRKNRLGDGFDDSSISRPPQKPSGTAKVQEMPIYLDDDTAPSINPPPETDMDSPNTLVTTSMSTSAPLREITPNSSPPKPALVSAKYISPPKIEGRDPQPSSLQEQLPPPASPQQQQPPPSRDSQDSSLGPAISSLLAHHQRSKANPRPPSSHSSDQPHQRRRRRQLFGRAPSNLSSHSLSNGIDFSRASSVDTMNTDGLGTPLDLSNTNDSKNNINNNDTLKLNKSNHSINNNMNTNNDFTLLYSASNTDDPDRIDDAHLQMTQLGYEDPDVAAWRERVALKMAGGKVEEGTTPGRKKGMTTYGKGSTPGRGKSMAAKEREESNKGSLGIAKRTRLASGR